MIKVFRDSIVCKVMYIEVLLKVLNIICGIFILLVMEFNGVLVRFVVEGRC